MKSIKIVTLTFLTLAIVMSCQKIDKYSNLDLLVDKEWHLISISENGEEVADSCELDNTVQFSKNGDLSNDFGTINCDEEYGAEEWKFQKEYTQIRLKHSISGNGISRGVGFERREIVQLSENDLVLKETYPADVQGMPRIFTYQKQ